LIEISTHKGRNSQISAHLDLDQGLRESISFERVKTSAYRLNSYSRTPDSYKHWDSIYLC